MCVVWLAVSTAANAATLTLAWDPSSGPDVAGYVIYWGTQSGVYGNNLNVGNQTQQQVSGLADGTTYYFVVRAYNSDGTLSVPSNEAAGSTPSSSGSGGGCTSCSVSSDFNGDRSPDLIFQNDTTRQAGVWYLGGSNGNSFLWSDWLASSSVDGWRLAATGDFNSDGKPDLVWQNEATRQVVVWYMGGSNGNTFLWWDWLAPSSLDGWRLVDATDINGDGKPDLIWQNDATYQAVVWYMGGANGSSFLWSDWLAESGPTGWRLVATGDFNSDGTPDLVWQNGGTFQVVVWYMGGSTGNSFLWWDWLSIEGAVGWTVVGTNDFNRDGKPDLVWQNDATFQVGVWYMGGSGGTVFQDWQWLATAGVDGWTAIAR
jgi:FG-GAP-like repeat/Fibronectin type III domain